MGTAGRTLDASYWEDDALDIRLGAGVPDVLKAKVAAAWADFSGRFPGHVLLSTSGSTGAPRLILISRQGLLVSARAVNDHLRCKSNDRWLCPLPLNHVGGLGVHARAYACSGTVVDLSGKWNPQAFVDACAAEHINLTSLVPAQVHDLVEAGWPAPDSLRAIIVGGGRLPPETCAAARALGWSVLQSYGMTEAGSQIATETLDALQQRYSGEWLTCLPHWELRTDDETGRLSIRGEALFTGSLVPDDEAEDASGWRFEPATSEDADGWFETQDRVEVRGAGGDAVLQLRFVSREDRQVKVLGELVSPQAIEARIRSRLPEAWKDRFAVIALPHERSENQLVAVLGYDSDSDGAAILHDALAGYNQNAAGFARITGMVMMPSLPRSDLGKVSRGELARQLAGGELRIQPADHPSPP